MQRFLRNSAPGTELDHALWEHYFVVGACAAGVVWGASGVLLFRPSSLLHQVVLAFVVGGMVAGAVPLLSSVRHAYWCFAIPAVLPISIRMLSVDDPVHLIMGLMIAIFGIAMLASSAQVHRLFRDSERLRHELLSSIQLDHALEDLVRLDSLTGIPNRRLFEEEFNKAQGEPWISEFEPAELAHLLRGLGFSKVDHLTTEAANRRYFADRHDNLRTTSHAQLMWAKV